MVSPLAMRERWGSSPSLVPLREMSFDRCGFTEEALVERVIADPQTTLGTRQPRVNLVEKYCDGAPCPKPPTSVLPSKPWSMRQRAQSTTSRGHSTSCASTGRRRDYGSRASEPLLDAAAPWKAAKAGGSARAHQPASRVARSA